MPLANLSSLKNLWFSNQYLNPLTKTLARKPAFCFVFEEPDTIMFSNNNNPKNIFVAFK